MHSVKPCQHSKIGCAYCSRPNHQLKTWTRQEWQSALEQAVSADLYMQTHSGLMKRRSPTLGTGSHDSGPLAGGLPACLL